MLDPDVLGMACVLDGGEDRSLGKTPPYPLEAGFAFCPAVFWTDGADHRKGVHVVLLRMHTVRL